jgi:hypothetical protein
VIICIVWAEGFASKCSIPFDDLKNDGCILFNKLSGYLRTQVSMRGAIIQEERLIVLFSLIHYYKVISSKIFTNNFLILVPGQQKTQKT